MVVDCKSLEVLLLDFLHHAREAVMCVVSGQRLNVSFRQNGYHLVLEGLIIDDLALFCRLINRLKLPSDSRIAQGNRARFEHSDVHLVNNAVSYEHH